MLLAKVLGTLLIATTLTACGTSGIKSVTGLSGLLGNELLSARGATREDQRKIDVTLEGGIRAGIWDRKDAPVTPAPPPKAVPATATPARGRWFGV